MTRSAMAGTAMQWTMGEVVKATGTTSRTLRHYDHIGLLPPSEVSAGGLRHYDEAALLRLQRILLLRELGLSLDEIGVVLGEHPPARAPDAATADAAATGAATSPAATSDNATLALRRHLQDLQAQRQRLSRLSRAVQDTIDRLEAGEPLVAEQMFDGFDHTQYREEVEQRWGKEAYASSDRWWRGLAEADKDAFSAEQHAIVEGFAVVSARGVDPGAEQAQEWARRQYLWVRAGWGGRDPSAEAFAGLGQMYVDDPRFGSTYEVEGRSFAAFVRDAMAVYAERHLA